MQKTILDPSLERAIALRTESFESSVWTHWLKTANLSDGPLLESLKEAGFSRDCVTKNIRMLLGCSTEELINVQLGQENFETAYLAALKLRCSELDLQLFKELCLSQDERKRELGVSLLYGDIADKFPKECLDAVLGLLETENSDSVVVQIAYAFKKFNFADRAEYLKQHVKSPNVALRESIAVSLAGLNNELSANLLIVLANDDALLVRSWAIFSLAYSQFDNKDVRQIFARALADSDSTVVQQAVLGLARRQDPLCVESITRVLESGEPTLLTLESILSCPRRDFIELLLSLKPGIANELQTLLDMAITSCKSA